MTTLKTLEREKWAFGGICTACLCIVGAVFGAFVGMFFQMAGLGAAIGAVVAFAITAVIFAATWRIL